MKKNQDEIMQLFDEMVKKGLVSSGNLWIETAIAQKNSQLSIALATSRLLTYDRIDQKILNQGKFN